MAPCNKCSFSMHVRMGALTGSGGITYMHREEGVYKMDKKFGSKGGHG